MAITPLPSPTPPGVVGSACAEVDALAGLFWAARSSGELVETVTELQRLKAKTAALEAELLADLDARDAAKKDLGWGSTGDWYTHTAGTTRREGRRTVRHASILLTDRTATHDALREGLVSPDQAAVVVDAVEQLPHTGDIRAHGEAFLLDQASRLNATDLHRAGRHLAAVVDPDRDERQAQRALDREDRAAHLGRFLTITDDGAGGVRVKGRGTTEDAAWLRAALLPLTKPQPADPTLLETGADRACAETRDLRDHGTRMWDALTELAHHVLETDRIPTSHGIRPRIAVTIPHHVLDQQTAGVGSTSDGLEITGTAVRRMACDADLIRVLLGPKGEILDVGRRHRLITPGLWTALVARDQHCAFPGCTRPPVMGHAHHIRHWTDGGATSLDNLVLLCGHHHRTIHHTPWQVRLSSHDHRPEFLPPAKHGHPPPDWIRHRSRLE